MSDKPICDLLVVLGNVDSEELGNGKIFRIMESPVVKNGMAFFPDLRMVDTSIRQASGKYLINAVLGKPNIVGGVELDKVRTISIRVDLIFPLKTAGKPMVYAVFPTKFEDVAESVKNNVYFGETLRLGYLIKTEESSTREELLSLGLSKGELDDKMSQSPIKIVELVKSVSDSFSQNMNNIKETTKREKPSDEDNQHY